MALEAVDPTEDDEEVEGWTKAQLGDAPWHPPEHSRILKHLSLGMPKASPLLHRQPSGRLR